MSSADRLWSARHPLCDCPDRVGWPFGVDIRPDTCAGRKVAHPVFGVDDVLALAARYEDSR